MRLSLVGLTTASNDNFDMSPILAGREGGTKGQKGWTEEMEGGRDGGTEGGREEREAGKGGREGGTTERQTSVKSRKRK